MWRYAYENTGNLKALKNSVMNEKLHFSHYHCPWTCHIMHFFSISAFLNTTWKMNTLDHSYLLKNFFCLQQLFHSFISCYHIIGNTCLSLEFGLSKLNLFQCYPMKMQFQAGHDPTTESSMAPYHCLLSTGQEALLKKIN